MRILRFFCLVIALAVILSVSVFAADPIITAQPQNYYFPAGTTFPATAYFSVMATGDNLSYQWQYSTVNAPTWTNFTSSSSKTPNLQASVPEHHVNGGAKYRCVITSSDGTVVSSVVSVSASSYVIGSIYQMVTSADAIIGSIFDWVGSACASIIGVPLLLIGVGFFALGAAIAILSRLLSRS